jgi:hypothetical protein
MAIYFTNYYYVPDSDFFDIQNTAISLTYFKLPESYQRLPLYSIFMAMLSIIKITALFDFYGHAVDHFTR